MTGGAGFDMRERSMKACLLRALILLAFWAVPAPARENWPELRGPERNGHSAAKKLPLVWSETNNIVWKTAVHDLGWSSPVVWGNQIWITTATQDGKHLFAVCVNSRTGKIVHDVKVFDTDTPAHVASVNSYASPTSAIEAGRVYVHYGYLWHSLPGHTRRQNPVESPGSDLRPPRRSWIFGHAL